MKKILFLLTCTLLVGCCADEMPDPIKIGENPVHHVVRPYHVEYNGHKYIYFLGSNGFSMVHSPDCSCCQEESTLW